MINSQQERNQELVSMINETITKPLLEEIQILKEEIRSIKDAQQVTRNGMNGDRVLSHYDHIIASLRNKNKITVAFFVTTSDAWKYDTIYRKMAAGDYFEPIIFICPLGHTDAEFFADKLKYQRLMQSYNYFKDSDYNYTVINTYNENDGTFLDIDHDYSIDLVFFQFPWGCTRRKYYIHYWCTRALTCYSYYGIASGNDLALYYDYPFHNKLWKYFLESEIHRELALEVSSIDTYNMEVTGYCFADQLMDKSKIYKNNWKTTGRKRIIWAPHHYLADFSICCFKEYSSFMLQLLEDYKDQIEIAFRPHPELKGCLYKDPDWGVAKTNDYYDKWNQLENGQLMEGDYLDYFFTSDGLILDSVAFMTEYLYTGKPSLFTVKEDLTSKDFSKFGSLLFELLYKGYSETDILNFVKNIINEGEDPRQNDRQKFLDTHFNISQSGSVSQDIIDHIKTQIQGK